MRKTSQVNYLQDNTNKIMFKILAKINKTILPSYSKQRLDLAKATKFQKAIIAWRYYITIHALEKKQK